MGFQVEKINNKKQKTDKSTINSVLETEISIFGNSFNDKKKEAFYAELYVLLNAGLELKDALDLIAQEQKKTADQQLISQLSAALVNGTSFYKALEQSKQFTNYEYYSVEIGEQSGVLQAVVLELSNFYKKRNDQKRLVMSALSYPAIILSTAMLAIWFMMNFVVPMFADIFKQNNVELPWITLKIIGFSSFMNANIAWIIVTLLIVVGATKFLKNNENYKAIKARLLLKIPFVGEFVRKVKIAQFTQALSLLIGAKVPVLQGIELTERMIDFYPLQKALKSVRASVLQGQSLSSSIKEHSIFDKRMASMIKVAEETNQNEVIFKRLTDQYTKDLEYKSKMLSTALEPFIVLFLGLVVGTILVAMYIPMFKLSTVIGS